ncbi:MAG TPA: hypothetical protein VMT27_05645, partial [Actinomycetes bacterium]|nr:hypothetical protein [Actinomycetes bacterium]
SAHSAEGQACTELRNVLLSGLPAGRGVIVIAEPEPGSGADYVAVNLGAAFARADHPTTLVVADVTSTVPAMLGVAHGPGLAEVLRKGMSVTSAMSPVTAVTGLDVLPPGVNLDTEVEDLEGAGINRTLRMLADHSDIVIIRAPATSAGADAQMLGRLADAAVAVIEIGGTHRDAIALAARQWHIVGTAMPGAVSVPLLAHGPEPIVSTR